MLLNAPNLLTLIRLALIPLLVLVYYLPAGWAPTTTMIIFILAAVTDIFDGYLARKLEQVSPLGAFLDPVADKLIVAVALVMLVGDPVVHEFVLDSRLFAIVVIVIIGREIAVSALREWMAEVGKRARVAVSSLGKVKTVVQMWAISMLLFRDSLGWFPVAKIGEILLYGAAALTLWSMVSYLRAAWPALNSEE